MMTRLVVSFLLLWLFSQSEVFCFLLTQSGKLSDGRVSRRAATPDPPTFSHCPNSRITTTKRRVTWTVEATDSAGGVVLKQVQGNPPGSLFQYGVHFIKYTAQNSAGVVATCSFIVDVKRTDCPKPSTADPDIRFRCNGQKYRSYCHLSCTSGATIRGSRYISCVQDDSEENKSSWRPTRGQWATCFKRTCASLPIPKNGALVCDKELGGSVCEMQCNDMFDVLPSKGGLPNFICGTNSSRWQPSNVVPDCEAEALPDAYFLPSEYYYFNGDCSNSATQKQAKKNFISNLQKIRVSPCISNVCSVYHVTITCGAVQTRKRASESTLSIQATFTLKNRKGNISPVEARSALETLAERSKHMFVQNIYKRSTSGEDFSTRSVDDYSIGDMYVKCPEGYGRSTKKTNVCVPCSKGSYADAEHQTCISCPVNTYQDKSASTSCISCPQHHGTMYPGMDSSKACEALCGLDTLSETGMPPCYPCPTGTYHPEDGGTTCLPCPTQSSCSTTFNGTFSQEDYLLGEFILDCQTRACEEY